MYRFAICDDDSAFLDNLADLLEETLHGDDIPFSLDTYADADTLLNAVRQDGKQYHVLLLDILMGKETGIELAKRLREIGVKSSIIFITAYPEYALDSFDVNPVHYLLKPVSRKALRGAIMRCEEIRRRDVVLTLPNSGRGSSLINLEDILYAEIFLTELKIHLKDGSSIFGVGRLGEMLSQLPQVRFHRCHRSFVVNLGEVAGISRFDFTMKNGLTVPIAQRKYSEAMWALSRYRS